MVSDLLVVTLAWFLAYWVRFHSGFIPPEKGIPAFLLYVPMCLFIWLIWAFMFKRMGLYKPMRGVRRIREVLLLVQANAFSVLLFIAVTYLFREKSVPFSRLVFLYFWIFATAFTIIQRSVLRSLLREARRRGYNLRYLLIIGAGKCSSRYSYSDFVLNENWVFSFLVVLQAIMMRGVVQLVCQFLEDTQI